MSLSALVILSAEDTDAPALPAICTVSKDEAWDDGGWAIGDAAASSGVVWIDRPYFTGNPSVEWAVERIDRAAAAGGITQLGNELNLPLEGWQGGSAGYDAWYAAVKERVGAATVLYQPPSPGVAGWQEWVSNRGAGAYGVHAYGTDQQMRDVVQWYLSSVSGQLYITECNFGAGQEVDVDQWAHAELGPFLAWCNEQARVVVVAYFAWVWDQSASLPTSVDARGTAVPAVLASGSSDA